MTERDITRLAAIIGNGVAGAKLARTLVQEGITSRRQLKRKDILARLPIASRASVLYNPVRSAPLAVAQGVADELVRRLVFRFATLTGWHTRSLRVLPVGSIRRRAAKVRDLDFLVVAPATLRDRALAAAVLKVARPGDRISFAETYADGPWRRGVIVSQKSDSPRGRTKHFRADLFITTPETLPFALFHHTGSSDYTIRVRAHAKRAGLKLNQYGIFDRVTGRRARGSATIKTEADLARFLGVTVRPPEDRGKTAHA